jgi:molecular chaperone GrpE
MTDPVPNTDELDPVEDTPAEVGEAVTAETEAVAADVATDEAADVGDEREGGEDAVTGEALDEELLQLREEFEGLNDRHLRLAAEFNNYRRRVDAERLDVWSRAQAEVVRKFVEVLDDLQRVAGLDLENATVEAIMEGIDLVERKFLRTLSDLGVEVVDPVGETFDPERMEAMMRVPAESEEDDDRVSQVFQKGYVIGGSLIRPARVSVHKHA